MTAILSILCVVGYIGCGVLTWGMMHHHMRRFALDTSDKVIMSVISGLGPAGLLAIAICAAMENDWGLSFRSPQESTLVFAVCIRCLYAFDASTLEITACPDCGDYNSQIGWKYAITNREITERIAEEFDGVAASNVAKAQRLEAFEALLESRLDG